MLENFRPAIKQGIIMGVISMLLFLVAYAIDPMFFGTTKGMMLNMAVNMLILPILFMVMGARDSKQNFSPFTFGNAFGAAFITSICAAVVLFLFNTVFLTVIDPNWEAEILQEALNSTELLMEDMGASQDVIDDAMEQTKEKMDKQAKGVFGALKTAVGSLFWFAILALIIGAVQKDKKEDLTA